VFGRVAAPRSTGGGGGTPGAPPNAGAIAPAFDGLPVTGETEPLWDAIVLLPTGAALAAGLDQLGPGGANINAPLGSDFATQRFQERIASHLDICIFERKDSPRHKEWVDCHDACRWWLSAIGSAGSQDSRGGHEGYDARMYGTMVGYDFPIIAEGVRAGAAFGYARTELDGSIFDNETDIDSYQGMLYFGYVPGPWFVNGGVTIGVDRYSNTRRVVLPGFESTAKSDYSGMQYGVFGNVGYRFYVGEGTVITPNAGLRYTHLTTDSYTETGGQGINLRVNSEKYDFFQSRLGVKATHDFALSNSSAFRPQLHAYWLQALGDRSTTNTAAFTAGGPAFQVSGVSPSRTSFNVGASVTLLSNRNWSIEAGYDFYASEDDFTAHQGSLNFVVQF
jgi:outer membrane autotransporter protein